MGRQELPAHNSKNMFTPSQDFLKKLWFATSIIIVLIILVIAAIDCNRQQHSQEKTTNTIKKIKPCDLKQHN